MAELDPQVEAMGLPPHGMIHGFVNPLDHLDAAGEAFDALGADLERAFEV